MLNRCDLMVRTAKDTGADSAVMQCVFERIRLHKHYLREQVARAVQMSKQCFTSALRAAARPACVQCGRQPVRTVAESDSKLLTDCAEGIGVCMDMFQWFTCSIYWLMQLIVDSADKLRAGLVSNCY